MHEALERVKQHTHKNQSPFGWWGQFRGVRRHAMYQRRAKIDVNDREKEHSVKDNSQYHEHHKTSGLANALWHPPICTQWFVKMLCTLRGNQNE